MKKLNLYSISAIILAVIFIGFYGCKKTSQDSLTAVEFDVAINGNEVTITNFKAQNLKNMVIPATYQGMPVTSIANNVFNYQQLLKTKYIFDAITKDTVNKYIGTLLLMEKVTLPNHIKNIGKGAFAIPSLKEIISLNPAPPNLGTGVFTTDQVLIIYVPATSLEAYQAQWTTEKIGTENIEWKTL